MQCRATYLKQEVSCLGLHGYEPPSSAIHHFWISKHKDCFAFKLLHHTKGETCQQQHATARLASQPEANNACTAHNSH